MPNKDLVEGQSGDRGRHDSSLYVTWKKRRQIIWKFTNRKQRSPRLTITLHNDDYIFAPNGDYSAWAIIENAIKTTQRWIYVQDQYLQYLVSRKARAALLQKIKQPSFEFLLILMSDSPTVQDEFRLLYSNGS